MSSFTHPPPQTTLAKLSFPAPHVALVTMSRPEQLNCFNAAMFIELTKIWDWVDAETTVFVAILTGSGRAFSTGADLDEWLSNADNNGGVASGPGEVPGAVPLSNRAGKKPIIAAVNGLALAGGCETVINCDLVVAAEDAQFGLLEIKRGLAAYAGALPRLIRTIGLQRASEFALFGDHISAQQAKEWGFVNKIVPREKVVEEAINYAKRITQYSLDAIVCTRAGLRQGWESASVLEATAATKKKEWIDLQKGYDMMEGLRAFKNRRTQASKL